jgi:hypothetical protein
LYKKKKLAIFVFVLWQQTCSSGLGHVTKAKPGIDLANSATDALSVVSQVYLSPVRLRDCHQVFDCKYSFGPDNLVD